MAENQTPTKIDTSAKKDAPLFVDGSHVDEQTLQEMLKEDTPIKFDWANKWLKGEEYSHILSHMDTYCKAFGLAKFAPKTHPDCIYI